MRPGTRSAAFNLMPASLFKKNMGLPIDFNTKYLISFEFLSRKLNQPEDRRFIANKFWFGVIISHYSKKKKLV